MTLYSQAYQEMLDDCGAPKIEHITTERGVSGGRRKCGGHLIPKGQAFTRMVYKVDGEMASDTVCDACYYGDPPPA